MPIRTPPVAIRARGHFCRGLIGFLAVWLLADAAMAQLPQQRIPRQPPAQAASIALWVHSAANVGIPGALVTVENAATGARQRYRADAGGIVRIPGEGEGQYTVACEAPGWQPYRSVPFSLARGEVKTLAITLTPAGGESTKPWRGVGPAPMPPVEIAGTYHELPRAEAVPPAASPAAPAPNDKDLYRRTPDRWEIEMPDWDRYNRPGEYPYTTGHWWDPFNRNKLKGDEPIIGQRTFLNVSVASNTLLDGRRLPVASDVSTARPGTPEFFGRGGELFLTQTFRFTGDLFHGDTSYRPVDWRIRITPAVNLNYLHTQETGIVNIDVRQSTTRVDAHASLQEAFVEAKLADLSPNYDFISLRAGIQQFSSDFRGFLFVEEQPGVRLFGNLKSNRLEYNAAYFYLLEKDTNSLLSTFEPRHQQVMLTNLYIQDFFWKGYTAQFSYHFNKDDASTHYDTNGFLVRPAKVGSVRPHNVRAHYLGWTGNGHIGRVNVSNAFYQALGHDNLNPIAGRRVDINAQMAALELSLDHDWMRYHASFFFASGDANPRDSAARGFDTIVDSTSFSGGVFSFWNRESIRLLSTAVQLTGEDSLLPNLRSNKFEGQANFVNPGVFEWNAGADFQLTPKITASANANFLRFHHTQALELLLFQRPIHSAIGADYSLGVRYRPPLTENMVITGGVSALTPWTGFRDIYSGKTLFSAFTSLNFRF
jgi:hypothetical protein